MHDFKHTRIAEL